LIANALNNRCWVHALKGQLSLALQDCTKAVTLRPTDPHLLDSLALTYLKMSESANESANDKSGYLDKAIKNYEAALQISPNQANSLYGHGLAKLKRKKKGMSKKETLTYQTQKKIKPTIADEFEKNYGVQ
jgi:tetratricopeptide (TPR) repeat protein